MPSRIPAKQLESTSWVRPVLVASTANLTLSSEQTIDGVLTSGNRILVKDQSVGSENGVYVTDASAWSRATDFTLDEDVFDGSTIAVQQGDRNRGKAFRLITDEPITVGSTALTFGQVTGLPFQSVVTVGTGEFTDYDTITEAVNAITGGLVFIEPGSYNETIPWNSLVTLIGLGDLNIANATVRVTVVQALSTSGQIVNGGTGGMSFINMDFTLTWTGGVGTAECILANSGAFFATDCNFNFIVDTGATGGTVATVRTAGSAVREFYNCKFIVTVTGAADTIHGCNSTGSGDHLFDGCTFKGDDNDLIINNGAMDVELRGNNIFLSSIGNGLNYAAGLTLAIRGSVSAGVITGIAFNESDTTVTWGGAGLVKRDGSEDMYKAVLRGLTADPSTLADGMVWYRSDTDAFLARRNGITETISMASDGGGGTSRQERVTTETIINSDTALTDTLDNTPVSNASVALFFDGLLMTQGTGEDYTISGITITWLAATGTAPNMSTNDDLIAYYLS